MTRPQWRDWHHPNALQPAVAALYEWSLFNSDPSLVGRLPRWAGAPSRWYPTVRLLRILLRETFINLEPDEDRYSSMCDRYEYRLALLTFTVTGEEFVVSGPYVDPLRLSRDPKERLDVERDFTARMDPALWVHVLGLQDQTELSTTLDSVHALLAYAATRYR